MQEKEKKQTNTMVFVLDTEKKPLAPCCARRGRELLRDGKASVWRYAPFTIILKRVIAADTIKADCTVKIDPGSRHTGVAVLRGEKVIWLGQIDHRTNVKDKLDKRRGYRRRRRIANLRYRQPRFDNRTKPKGWLPPSIQSKADNIINMTKRLMRLVPVKGIAYEDVKFDTRLMQDAEVSGVSYQRGELTGYEVREYLLEKCGRKCAYCGAENIPLEVEHIIPKSRGGSNRVSNLTLACHSCNTKKGSKTAAEFGHPEVQAKAKTSLKSAAIMNAMRFNVRYRLYGLGVPVELGSGGLTKMNRITEGLPKEHYYDACCVGASTPEHIIFLTDRVQMIEAKGRGQYQRTKPDRYGFPRLRLPRQKQFYGYQTGDMVSARVTKGKKQGTYCGRVSVRTNGSFNIQTKEGGTQGISYKYCRKLQTGDGYCYGTIDRTAAFPLTNKFVGIHAA